MVLLVESAAPWYKETEAYGIVNHTVQQQYAEINDKLFPRPRPRRMRR